jgi:hypothetical protein
MFTPPKSISASLGAHIDVELSRALEQKAQRAAQAAGIPVAEFVRRALEEKVGEIEAEQGGDWFLTASETRALMDLVIHPRSETRRFRAARKRARSLFGRLEF